MSERSIFLLALDLDDPADRAAYLDAACADDPALRGRVEDLLAAAAADGFMTRPAADRDPLGSTGAPETGPPAEEAAGTLLAGRYRLGPSLGAGGMGVVYRAEQVAPVRRAVAVKVIRPGTDSDTVLARFEAERQALAVMDHPNIAKVFDAGATADGRPFFVMELVEGTPLTEYCDAQRLPVPERLALFRTICAAVQHAHQKGVIHRDLKPGNILVEARDGVAVPKVIDFGLAKSVGGAALTEQTLLTAAGAVAGTPLYMAPEQAGGGADVDTRADVYALGVVLYELLTGTTPIRRETLKNAALHELLRVIREEEPPAPSRRLGASDSTPGVAANRRIEPARLGRLVRGDLDWVVMRALEKDRDRRYESAAAFAADVDRFLNHEPVSAGPPSAGYRLRKFVRRNRAAVAATALVFALLVAGVVGTTWGLLRADAQRRRADDEAETVREVNAILQQDILRQADPRAQADRGAVANPNLTLREALDRAAARIDARLGGKPAVEAGVRRAIGEAYVALGLPDRGIPHLERAAELFRAHRGPAHLDTLGVRDGLGVAYRNSGDTDRAVRTFEEVLRTLEDLHGPAHQFTLTVRGNLAQTLVRAKRGSEALGMCRETLEAARAHLGPDHEDTLVFATTYAQALYDAGQADAALALLEDTAARGRTTWAAGHPDLVTVLANLGNGYREARQFERAVPPLREAAELAERVLPTDHPEQEGTLEALARALVEGGDDRAAVPVLERLVAVSRRRRGPTDPDHLANLNNLAEMLRRTGNTEKAAAVVGEAVAAAAKAVGPNDRLTIVLLNTQAEVYRTGGDPRAAVPLFEDAVSRAATTLGPADPATLQFRRNLAVTYRQLGRPAAARQAFLEWLAGVRRTKPAGSAALAGELRRAGGDLLTVGGSADAEPVLRECVAVYEGCEPDGWAVAHARSLLGAALVGRGRYADAETVLKAGYRDLLAQQKELPANARSALPETADRLVELYVRWHKPDEVKRWQAERAKYPRETLPPPREVNGSGR